MARLTIVSLVLAVATLLCVVELLRRRRLREKYAVLWLVVAVTTVVLGVVPSLLTRAAALLGFQTPSNLLFLASSVTLFAVSMQLSGEVGVLEEQTRRLAEEVGALRMKIDDVERRQGAGADATHRWDADDEPLPERHR